jgi:signal peptidase I
VRRVVKDVLLPIAVAVALAFVIQASVAKPYEIPTPSMVPTIQVNDRIIANRLIYRFRDVDRGDIIVFDPPPAAARVCGNASTGIPFVKRVIGIPGDRVVVGEGRTLVNGRPFVVEEAETPQYEQVTTVVPEDSLFVLGDNRNSSCDSHEWGVVPRGSVIGQAEITYWPPTHVTFLD